MLFRRHFVCTLCLNTNNQYIMRRNKFVHGRVRVKNCKNQLAVELMIIYDHVLCPFIVLFNFQKDARESVNCDTFRRFFYRSEYVCIFFNWFSWSNVHTVYSARACISTESMEKLVYCIWVENIFWIQCQTLFAILVLADFNFGSQHKRDPI